MQPKNVPHLLLCDFLAPTVCVSCIDFPYCVIIKRAGQIQR